MKKPDYRTVQDILKHPRWDTVIATLDPEGVTAPMMRVLDDFLAFLEGQELASIWSLKPSDFLSFNAGYQSANRLRTLKRAMEAVFPNRPAILILTDAIRLKEAELRPPISKKGRKRSLKVTIPANDLPQDWQDALADMTAGFDRPGAGAPSLNMIPTYQMKLRQFAFSAGKAGLPAAFSVAAILAYVRDMRARGLAAATQRASVSALAKCARYLAAGPDVMELLADLERTCEAKARKACVVARLSGLSQRAITQHAANDRIAGAAKHGGLWTFDHDLVLKWINEGNRCQRKTEKQKTSSSRMARSFTGSASKSTGSKSASRFEQLLCASRKKGRKAA